MFCQSQAFPTEKIQKRPDFGVQKSRIFKIWLQKSQIGNPGTKSKVKM